MTLAPASATVAGSRCSALWKKNDEDRQHEDRHRAARLRRAPRSTARRRAACTRVARLGRDLQPRAEREVEPGDHDRHRDDDDRREVRDERAERQAGVAGDEDVRRVADQRRRAADVRGEDLDEHERDRVDVERVGEQERDRHDEQDRRDVVEEGRQHGGRDRRARARRRAAARATTARRGSPATCRRRCVSVRRTMIIIPTSRPIVLKSIASTACSWSIVCVSRTSVAPSSATFVRSTRSEAMSASATTKMSDWREVRRSSSGVDDVAPTRLPGSPPTRLVRRAARPAPARSGTPTPRGCGAPAGR